MRGAVSLLGPYTFMESDVMCVGIWPSLGSEVVIVQFNGMHRAAYGGNEEKRCISSRTQRIFHSLIPSVMPSIPE
jgi:hypothetical protein